MQPLRCNALAVAIGTFNFVREFRRKIFQEGGDTHRVYGAHTLLIGNVTERNAHIASAGGVYAGSYYLKCTAAVSHTGPPAGQTQNSEARDTTRCARSFARLLA